MGTKKSKLLASTIAFVIAASGAISSFTYAFFSVDLDAKNILNIAASFSEIGSPVFMGYTDKDITMNVTAASMLEGNGPSVASSASANLTAELTGGSDNRSVTCLYDIYFEATKSGYDTYVPSNGVAENDLMEYTLTIMQGENSVLEETPINKLTSGSHIVVDESITSSGETTKKIYKVTSTIYNLDINQTIYGKKFVIVLKIDNPRCTGDSNE